MTAAPDSPHRRAALMEAAGAAGLHKLTSRVFWLGSEQATYGDRFQTSRIDVRVVQFRKKAKECNAIRGNTRRGDHLRTTEEVALEVVELRFAAEFEFIL